jgi:peptidyl-prolyl cis-trans isomerase C
MLTQTYKRTLFQLNIVIIFCLLPLTGCGDTGKPTDSDTPRAEQVVAAEVNGEPISLDELNRRFLPVKLQYSQGLPPQVEKNLPRMQQEFLQKLIDKKLLLQEAKKHALKVTEAELQDYINQISGLTQNQQDNQDQPESTGDKEENLSQKLEEELLIKKLIRQEVSDNIIVPEEEAQAYYQSHPEEFDLPERVRIRQIVVETDWEADEIRDKIMHGESFAKLAEATSLSPDGANGGDLGYFSRGHMPPEFDKVAFSLHDKEISRVFKSSYGYHIFQLEDKQEAKKISYAEAREKIIHQLKIQKQDKELANWLIHLRKKNHIQINPYFAE